MTIAVECPNCGKVFQAVANLIGKKAKCRACGRTFQVEASKTPEPPPLPTAPPPPPPESIAVAPAAVRPRQRAFGVMGLVVGVAGGILFASVVFVGGCFTLAGLAGSASIVGGINARIASSLVQIGNIKPVPVGGLSDTGIKATATNNSNSAIRSIEMQMTVHLPGNGSIDRGEADRFTRGRDRAWRNERGVVYQPLAFEGLEGPVYEEGRPQIHLLGGRDP